MTDHDSDDSDLDFSLVHADDAWLDILGAGDPAWLAMLHAAHPDVAAAFDDTQLAALLLAWRQDVDAEPIGNPIEPKAAVAAVTATRTAAPAAVSA